MKVALIQMNAQENKAANLASAASLMARAVEDERPDLIVLPEMFMLLAESVDAKRAAAEDLPGGEAYEMLRAFAARHRVFVHGGSLLERAGDKFFNTTVVFDREGREVARYRKIHLFDVTTPDGRQYRESATFERGGEIVTYDLDGRTVGCSICYDIRFPELYQALMRQGAEVIVVPAAFTLQTGKDHWEVLMRARAIETTAYVVACGVTGSFANGTRQTYGHSLVANPWGHVIAQAPDKVGVLGARLDFAYRDEVRAMIPVHTHKVL